YKSVVALLLNNGAHLEARGYESQTPLIVAVENKHLELVQFLMENDANPEVEDSYGCNVLDVAIRWNLEQKDGLIRLLLVRRNIPAHTFVTLSFVISILLIFLSSSLPCGRGLIPRIS